MDVDFMLKISIFGFHSKEVFYRKCLNGCGQLALLYKPLILFWPNLHQLCILAKI